MTLAQDQVNTAECLPVLLKLLYYNFNAIVRILPPQDGFISLPKYPRAAVFSKVVFKTDQSFVSLRLIPKHTGCSQFTVLTIGGGGCAPAAGTARSLKQKHLQLF